LNSVDFSNNNRLRNLLTVRFVTSVVLDLNVQIQAPFTAVKLLTISVWAHQLSFDLVSAPSVVFLSARNVSFLRAALNVLSIVVKLLNYENLFQKAVPIGRLTADLSQQRLVPEVHLPVELIIVHRSVKLRHRWEA